MIAKKIVMSKETFSEAMEGLEETLAGMKVKNQEILMARLLLEETFLRLEGADGGGQDFSVQVAIRKRLGDVSLRVASKGEAYNPIVTSEETAENEEDRYILALLRSRQDAMSYVRRNQENIVSIQVHKSGSKSTIYTFGAMILGSVLGIVAQGWLDPAVITFLEENLLIPVEKVILCAVKMMVSPLIFFSIMAGFCGMSDTTDIARIGKRLIAVSILRVAVSILLAIFLGLGMCHLFGTIPMEMSGNSVSMSSHSIRDVLTGIVPDNLVSPFSTNQLLQVLFLACFFGMLLSKSGERASLIKDGIEFFRRFFMDAMRVIMPIIPLFVGAAMMHLMLRIEPSALLGYSKLLVAACLNLLICIFVSVVFVMVIGRISPIPFLKKAIQFLPIPLTITTSTACMPYTLKFCEERLGVHEKLLVFAIPAGMQFNKSGIGGYLAMMTIFTRLAYGMPLDMNFLCTLFVSALIISLSSPSVTSGEVISLASVFDIVGIPSEALAIFFALSSILAMGNVSSNVLGNITTTFLLARKEGKVDEKVYMEG